MKTYVPTPKESEMLRIMQAEKSSWEEGQVWVTDKVGFWMREMVKNARKNYFGIFRQEIDPVTGRKKIFVPLTEWVVENVLKNIDIDTKNIHVEPRKPEASIAASVFDLILKNKLEKAGFGRILNLNNQNIVIDGTGFLKAWKDTDDEKPHLKVSYQDRLHITVDPAAADLEQSTAITEENVLSIPELREYKEWANVESVIGDKNVDRTGNLVKTQNNPTEIPLVRVYERYGWATKFVLTGNEKDRNEYVYVLSVASELDSNPVVHLIKEVEDHPYQEFKFKDVLNRFDGRGIPEKLMAIQEYINETVNTRLNTARIVQLGLWRIDPSMNSKQLKDLFSTTGIKATQGQIERLNTGTIDASSYKDEEVAYEWAKRVTQTTNEDEVSASRPATNALIEERGANKGYDLIMENILLNLGKFIKDKIIPIIIDTLEDGEIEKITGDPQVLEKIERPFARNEVRRANSQAFMETGRYLYNSKEEEDMAVQQLIQQLNEEFGNKRFIPIIKAAFDTDYEIRIDPSNDVVNKGVLATQLTNVMNMLTGAGVPINELKDVAQELFDVMGLPGEKLVEKIGTTQQMPSSAIDPGMVGTPSIEATNVPTPA